MTALHGRRQNRIESGLDNFGARYYTSNMGRFMTADWAEKPEDVPYASLGDPQSLNLYSYASYGLQKPISQRSWWTLETTTIVERLSFFRYIRV